MAKLFSMAIQALWNDNTKS